MPGSFKQDPQFPITDGTLILGRRPRCAIKVGLVTSEWAVLEERFLTLFAIITSKVERSSAGTLSFRDNPLAREIVASLESASVKQGIVRTQCKKNMSTFVPQLDVAIKALRKAAKGRNRTVHWLWGITEQFPEDVILCQSDGSVERYREADFDAIIGDIHHATTLVLNLYYACEDFLAQQGEGPTE